MLNQYLMAGTFVFLGLVAVFWVVSLVQVGRKGTVAPWVNRGLYLAGIAAVILNLIRMCLVYTNSRGTMVFANVVVLICIIVALVRMEMHRGDGKPEEDASEDKQ